MRKDRSAAAIRRNRGFTLIEIMAVVLIMGLLMAVVGVNIKGQIDKAKLTTAKAQISQLENALEFYRMDNSRYPSTSQGLDALVQKPSGTPEPRNYPPEGYLRKSAALIDPWGVRFEYASPGTNNPHSFDLWSNGADQEAGGEGGDSDIGNWESDRPGAGA
ncbi:MAG: type II secretion system major pseudopilin GspG [Deltaproteobacteria bacterium]|jgi:general secretion pathway protein G|nr:type II secretion system major pseudopilin GspG [Deltaproteobacteria bacterium]MBW2382789.1 type II secretion system major pseudopilin GspG [Deltaproteobacteria bacterium]